MVDLYGNAAAYERGKQQLNDWPITDENRERIKRYLQNAIDHLSPGRRATDLWLLRKLFVGTRQHKRRSKPFVTKPLGQLTLTDFETIRSRINAEIASKDTYEKLTGHLRNLYEDAFRNDPTKAAILQALFLTGRRRFFRWPNNDPVNTSIATSKYYTAAEFTRILRVAQRPKERALLALAWEGTGRPNEYLSATVGDVEELPQGFRVRVHISKRRGGKTQYRYMYVFAYRAEFNEYWRTHALRDDAQAPLFYREDNKGAYGRPLGPAGANTVLKKLDWRSGVRKNGTLYFLRHGGYTWKRLEGMNPALAGKDMGWSPGGKEERRYLHLAEEEVMAERLRLADAGAVEPRPKTEARSCPFCHAANSPVDTRCRTCGQTLDMHTVLKELAEMKKVQASMIEQQVKTCLADYAQGSPPV